MIWPFTELARLRAELALAQSVADVANMVAKKDRAELAQAQADKMALAAQLAQACRERDEAQRSLADEQLSSQGMKDTLGNIATSGAASANGTARKLARMAREALE